MTHDVPLIATIAAALGVALVFGYGAVRLGLPALVGYLVAGILLGPATPGMVADVGLALQLAEIGVMLLMFGVGLHFSLGDLVAVRRIAVPGAVAQIAAATILGGCVGLSWGWSVGAAVVFGLALSVASTVVLLQALENRHALDTIDGHIAVGWLVVEDLAMVLVLVLLPALSTWIGGSAGDAMAERVGATHLLLTLALTLGKMSLFLWLMLVGGRRLLPKLLWSVARTNSRELFTLCIIAAAVGIAYVSGLLFGASYAFGAFVSGMVLRESALSHRAATQSLPLRDAFAVLFFVSVGMLFDPTLLIREPGRVLVVMAIVVVGKSLVGGAIVLAFRYPPRTAMTVSAGLAQIGEFSFILGTLGVELGILPKEGESLIVAGALSSIALNPVLFAATDPLAAWIESRSGRPRHVPPPTDPLAELPSSFDVDRLTGHVLLVGYGRVGSRIGEALLHRRVPIVVAEENREIVERLRERGVAAVYGDASQAPVLIQAHIARASMLVIAAPDAFAARKMLEIARMLNPGVQTVVRTHSDDEAALLRKEHAGAVFIGEHELALGMIRHVLDTLTSQAADAAHATVTQR